MKETQDIITEAIDQLLQAARAIEHAAEKLVTVGIRVRRLELEHAKLNRWKLEVLRGARKPGLDEALAGGMKEVQDAQTNTGNLYEMRREETNRGAVPAVLEEIRGEPESDRTTPGGREAVRADAERESIEAAPNQAGSSEKEAEDANPPTVDGPTGNADGVNAEVPVRNSRMFQHGSSWREDYKPRKAAGPNHLPDEGGRPD